MHTFGPLVWALWALKSVQPECPTNTQGLPTGFFDGEGSAQPPARIDGGAPVRQTARSPGQAPNFWSFPAHAITIGIRDRDGKKPPKRPAWHDGSSNRVAASGSTHGP